MPLVHEFIFNKKFYELKLKQINEFKNLIKAL